MNKKALVITFHLKNCKRVGGFHTFIDILLKNGYDVDWLTTNVNASWLLRKTDRENIYNFFTTWKGIYFEKYGSKCHHFSVPFLVPGKIKKNFCLSKYELNYSKWKRIKRKLSDSYDVILVEGSGAQYGEELRRNYPYSKIIYRPSDILCTVLKDKNADEIELNMIKNSNCVLCVDENQINYYKKLGVESSKLKILRNPLSTNEDITILKNYNPVQSKNIVYIGASFCDFEFIEYAASQNPNLNFYIIGPFNKKSYNNVIYTGSLSKEEFETYLLKAQVALAPIKLTSSFNLYGYTGKIIMYMKYLLPIVATNFSNYLEVNGVYNVSTKEEFSFKISELASMSANDRMEIRNDYIRVLKNFTYDNTKETFERELAVNSNE